MIKFVIEPSYAYFWDTTNRLRTFVFRSREDFLKYPNFRTSDSDVDVSEIYTLIDVPSNQSLLEFFDSLLPIYPEYFI